MMLRAENLFWSVGDKTIINNVSLQAKPGHFLGIIGPNGSGKSSLMSLLTGIRKPSQGSVFLNNKPLNSLKRIEIARCLAFIEQHADTGERISVRQAAELGRTPYLSVLSPFSQKDHDIVNEALTKTDMLKMADRIWQTLSGGEKQRVHFSRALAQQPEILLLDEPTNHLDIHHQMALLSLVRNQGLTIIAALHDLNHAAMFCDEIAVLDQGKIFAQGSPKEVMTEETIRQIFKVEVEIMTRKCGNLNISYIAPQKIKKMPLETGASQTIRNCA
ncbi:MULTISPECIES: ABC transporter ATP-binding protein [unclassified Bartonella]|uniref:ABC transporter ATP-binding protein n=1 Tax=unclassified Bartonella TaxID=2645622 RepID=UPI0015F97BA1|nr:MULTISPECIES: ABC transporter ATP-binding protein [unclassified Bartonella]UXN04721.1 ABC transporter ATP-binding protein [Bartonella sp. HY406]UXN07772.1 ABC transporter ATP-binding protein [Bartonella sp. HY761]